MYWRIQLWYGIRGPKGVPATIVARWQGVVSAAVQSGELKKRFDWDGLDYPAPGPAYFGKVLRRDIVNGSQVVKAANI